MRKFLVAFIGLCVLALAGCPSNNQVSLPPPGTGPGFVYWTFDNNPSSPQPQVEGAPAPLTATSTVAVTVPKGAFGSGMRGPLPARSLCSQHRCPPPALRFLFSRLLGAPASSGWHSTARAIFGLRAPIRAPFKSSPAHLVLRGQSLQQTRWRLSTRDTPRSMRPEISMLQKTQRRLLLTFTRRQLARAHRLRSLWAALPSRSPRFSTAPVIST